MTQYCVIKAKNENFHRAMRYQTEYTDGGEWFPGHYWDIETEEIVMEGDAFQRFATNDKWAVEDAVNHFDCGLA